jgi:hypothetical protein
MEVEHLIDRVCVARCISYADYEPATGQFRLRAVGDGPMALRSPSDSRALQTGSYVVSARDLPLYQIYPCGAGAFDLCGRWLREGEVNGAENFRPVRSTLIH